MIGPAIVSELDRSSDMSASRRAIRASASAIERAIEEPFRLRHHGHARAVVVGLA